LRLLAFFLALDFSRSAKNPCFYKNLKRFDFFSRP
jgi:hypothetical protein